MEQTTKKRLLSLLLTVSMVLGMVAMPASAYADFTVDPGECSHPANRREMVYFDDGNGVSSKETCEHAGMKRQQCQDCGKFFNKFETVPAIEFDPAQTTEQIVTPATCQKPGTKTLLCKFCGGTVPGHKQEGVVIPAVAHSYEGAVWKSDATQHWKECVTCKAEDGEIAKSEQANHTWNTASGDVDDPKVGVYCTICNYYKVEPEHEHKFSDMEKHTEARDATCTVDGHQEYWQCTDPDCPEANAVFTRTGDAGEYVYEQKGTTEALDPSIVIPALGHDWDGDGQGDKLLSDGDDGKGWTPDGNSSCVDGGTASRTCKRAGCNTGDGGAAVKETKKLTADGHQLTLVPANLDDAKCLERLIATPYYHCEKCNKNFRDNNNMAPMESAIPDGQESFPAPGHSFGAVVAEKAATCVGKGNVSYKYCSTCGKNYQPDAGQFEPYEKAIENVETNATGVHTDKADGDGTGGLHYDGTNHWKVCSVCGQDFDKTAHDFAGGSTCTVCGYSNHVHDEGKWVTNGKQHWKVCTECNEELPGTRADHDLKPDIKNSADAHGLIVASAQVKCDACGFTDDAQVSDPVETTTVKATCEGEGTVTRTWTITYDGDIEFEPVEQSFSYNVAALGHAWDRDEEWNNTHSNTKLGNKTEPTCYSEGTQTYICQFCVTDGIGVPATKDVTLAKTAHNYEDSKEYQQTEAGHAKKCVNFEHCGSVSEQVDAHEYGDKTPPEDFEDATCTVCGYVYGNHVHKDHLTKHEKTLTTCVLGGDLEYYTCTCGKWFWDENGENLIEDHGAVTVAKGSSHVVTKWFGNREMKEGEYDNTSKHYGVCDVCGREVSAFCNPGAGENTVVSNPTCTARGVQKRPACTDCGKQVEEYFGEPLGHAWDRDPDWDNSHSHALPDPGKKVEPTCYSEGSETYICQFCVTDGVDEPASKDVVLAKTAHNYEDSTEYQQTEAGHAKKCVNFEHCSSVSGQVDAHNYGDKTPPEDFEDATCTVCGYVYTGHVHKDHLTKHEKVLVSCPSGGTKEYYTCTCGKWFWDENGEEEIPEASREEDIKIAPADHTVTKYTHYNGTGDISRHRWVCDVCDGHGTQSCTYGEWTEKTAATCTTGTVQTRTCQKCGFVDERTLDDAKGHTTTSGWVNTDDTQHWKVCDVCGEKFDVEVHTRTNGNCTTDSECPTCHHVFVPAPGHDFDSGIYRDNNDGTHSAKCKNCNEYDAAKEEHVYEEYAYVSDGTAGHHQECTKCGHKTDTIKHVPYQTANEGKGTHHVVCDECGQDLGDEACTMTAWARKDENQHSRYCKVCGGNEEVENHTGAWENSTGTPNSHHYFCPDCGYSSGEIEHTIKTVSDGESGHHDVCEVCNYSTSTEPHVLTAETTGIEGLFIPTKARVYCEECDFSKDIDEVLQRTDDHEDPTCEEDGYDKVVYYVSYGGQTFDLMEITTPIDATGHDFESGSEYQITDTTHDKLCANGCGTAEGKPTAHTWDKNPPEDHADAVCTVCGYAYSGHVHDWYTAYNKGVEEGFPEKYFQVEQNEDGEWEFVLHVPCSSAGHTGGTLDRHFPVDEYFDTPADCNFPALRTYVIHKLVDPVDPGAPWNGIEIMMSPPTGGPLEGLGHVWEREGADPNDPDTWKGKFELVEKVEPTCTTEGKAVYECKECYDRVTHVITLPALNHEWKYFNKVVNYPGNVNECVNGGVRAHWECTRCGGCFDTQDIDAEDKGHNAYIYNGLGHILNPGEETNYSWDDFTHYLECSRCGSEVHFNEKGELVEGGVSHTYGGYVSITKDGKSGHMRVCTVCGASGVGMFEDHVPSADWVNTDPNYHWKTCTLCGEILDKTAHNYGEVTDCTATRVCQDCGYEAPALGHDIERILAKDATCTESGNYLYYVCKRCHNIFQDLEGTIPYMDMNHDGKIDLNDVIVPALGHDTEGVDWSSDETGHWKVCKRCGEKAEQSAHTPDHDATCTEASTCTVCGYEIQAALGHTWGYKYYDDGEEGHHRVCSVCGALSETEEHIPDREAPGCYYAVKCKRCYHVLEEATGHLWKDWTQMQEEDITWTQDASGRWTVVLNTECQRGCGEPFHNCTRTMTGDGSWPTGKWHFTKSSDPAETFAATCTADGQETWRCTFDEYSATTMKEYFNAPWWGQTISHVKVLPATGHKFGEVNPAVPATCISDGNVAYKTCENCGKNFAPDAAVDSEEPIENVVIPSDPDAHQFPLTRHEEKAPNCTTDGNKEYWTCELCHKNFQDENAKTEASDEWLVLTATGHNWSDWQYNDDYHWKVCLNPGCPGDEEGNVPAKMEYGMHQWVPDDSKGEDDIYCSDCHALLHKGTGHMCVNHLRLVPYKAPTCVEPGNIAYYICDVELGDNPGCYKVYLDKSASILLGENGDLSATVITAAPDEGHAVETIPGKEPTCTEPGLTPRVYCPRCGKVFVEQVEISALGHNWELTTEATDPTCTEPGYTALWTCQRCKATKGGEKIEALGHDPIPVPGKDPTCTEDGLSEGTVCARCGETLVEQKPITATGHSFGEAYDGKDSTGHWHICTVCGAASETEDHVPGPEATETTEQTCTVCGWVIQEALGHTHTMEQRLYQAPTCTEDGHESYWFCTGCEKYFDDVNGVSEVTLESVTITKLGHLKVIDPYVEPTCQHAGKTEGSHCARCGVVLDEQFDLPQKEHQPVTIPGKQPTCTESGWTDGAYCQRCGMLLQIREPLDKLPHSYEEGWTSDSIGHWHVCTVCGDRGGYEGHTSSGSADETTAETCTVCGRVLTPALGHIHANHLTRIPAKASTCTEEGNYAYYRCDCGALFLDYTANSKVTEEDVIIPKLAHIEVEIAAVNPTCTEPGWTAGVECFVCHTVLVEPTFIPATGHTIVEVPGKDATCTDPGLTAGKACSVCGFVELAQSEIPALGHDYVVTPGTESTCTEPGVTEKKVCKRCNDTVGGETVDALGHDLEKVEAKDPTCTEAGNDEYFHCKRCGKAFSDADGKTEIETPVKKALGHAYGEDWTCDGDAHWHECERCGDKKDYAEHSSSGPADEGHDEHCTECGYVIAPATGHVHSLVPVEAVEPTCTEKGSIAYYVCQGEYGCGKLFSDAEGQTEIFEADTVVPAAGHKFGEWKVVEDATDSKNGREERTCTVCGTVESRTIAATGSATPSPKTGDEADLLLWSVLVLLSGAGMAVVLGKKRKFN